MNKRSQKHNRQSSIHVFMKQPSSQTEYKRPLGFLREFAGLATAGTGIFAALLYLAGRSFSSGYFGAMNIPNYQISFSIWEYGEAGWLPMIFFPAVIIIILSYFAALLFGLRDYLLNPLLEKLSKNKKTGLFEILRPRLSKEIKFSVYFFLSALLIIAFIWFVNKSLVFVREIGSQLGQTYVIEKAPRIEISSITALPLASEYSPIQTSDLNYYIYDGYRLLTFNNNRYYLFKEINPSTCSPSKVFIINAEQNIQVNLLPPESLKGQCEKKGSSAAIPTKP